MSVRNPVKVIRKNNWVICELPNAHIAEKFMEWLPGALKKQTATKRGAQELALPKDAGLKFIRPNAIA